jgi:diguanylate cyclase (GGDEF)-like protein
MNIDAALLSLTGLSVGDAFGQSLFFPQARTLIDRRELPPAPWRWTDDTQLALSVVEELRLRGWIDQDYLARRMAWRYTTDPARGYGRSTRQVLGRIAQGEYFRVVSRSVYNGGSFGCSGAARTAPLGAFFSSSPAKAAREAPLAAAVTHLHPEGLAGAQAVAVAAAIAAKPQHAVGGDYLQEVLSYLPESQIRQNIERVVAVPVSDLDGCLKLLSGDDFGTVQTAVPFSLWCAAHHLDDFEAALWLAVSGLGNRDTTCSIVGGIVALSTGQVPAEWTAHREPLPESALLGEREAPIHLPAEQRQGTSLEGIKAGNGSAIEAPLSIRADPLIGLPNLLGLLDRVDQLAERTDGFPLTLAVVHLVPLWDINRSQGHTRGDNFLCECARSLQAMGLGEVFRLGGDKFAILLQKGSQTLEQSRQIARQVTQPSYRLPRTALIHFAYKEEAVGGRLLACVHEALRDLYYQENDGCPREFDATQIRAMPDYSWMVVDLADQMRRMAQRVDDAERLAQTDPISQLPNLRAAMKALEAALKQASETKHPLAILLFDGDNLRQYNQISYEAGDEAIRLLGSTLRDQLRQTDFLARWRTGDEFLIILPDTDQELAIQIGNRICKAVSQASQSWRFPSTISGGIALFPEQGPTLQDLLHVAEKGMDRAKASGKNQVIIGIDE